MALPDVSTLTVAELQQLMQTVNSVMAQKQQEEHTERESAKVELQTAYNALTALIGPDNPATPGLNSYTEIQKYTDAQILGNVALAIRKILQGAELQARITRNIVKVFVE